MKPTTKNQLSEALHHINARYGLALIITGTRDRYSITDPQRTDAPYITGTAAQIRAFIQGLQHGLNTRTA